MARPRSTSKVSKPRGGTGPGKRKHGGAPPSGGAAGRPAKQSRREGRSKPVDRDIYEAEDSDPDEVKHSERYDQVDNYEYELPSDFEDEEIDEELAFTEEDKKKFGSWFEKEVSADEDDGDVGDGDDWADEDEEDADDTAEDDEELDAEGGDRKERRASAVADDGDGGDDLDDLFLDDDDDDQDGNLGEDEGDDDDLDEDDERHRAMLREVLGAAGADGARKRARRDPNAAVVSEAYPESEYNLNPGAASAGGAAGSLSVADLLRGLTPEERRKLGTSRKLLEKVAGAGQAGAAAGKKKGLQPVGVPLPTLVVERQERKAGYEAASKDVTKWQPIVKANREVPTLRLVSGREDIPRVTTTEALVAQHTPSADNALEAEVAALLQAAGAASAEAIEEAEEKLALKALSLEEARERRERLAKLRSLLFYHELKARRLKAIKSKEYHRHLAKAAKRKAAKLAAATADASADGADVDAERVAAIEAEFQRAKERLTLRHRNSSRWARRALKRGQLQVDPGTKAALAEQLQLGQQLKRKIEGRKGSGSDDDSDSGASTSASDSEGEGQEGARGLPESKGAGRVRSAALELLAGGDTLDLSGDAAPKKGLLALPFMKRAMERRRLEAQQQAQEVLRELEEQEELRQREEEEEAGAGGEKEIGGSRGGLLEALVGYGVPAAAVGGVTGTSGRRRFGGGADAAAAAEDGEEDGAEDSDDLGSDDLEDADAKAERLGRKKRQDPAVAAKGPARKAASGGGGAGAGAGKQGQRLTAPPTAEEQADLDAALEAGAAGRGLLVGSADAGLDLRVPAARGRRQAGAGAGTEADEEDGAAAAERRASHKKASSSRPGAAGANVGGKKPGVLSELAAHQASLAAGGGRAALFEGKEGVAAGTAEAAGTASGPPAKFVAAQAFTGPKPGYAFKRGPQGLGYYLDPKSAKAEAAAANGAAAGGQADQAQGKRQGGKGKGKGAAPEAGQAEAAVAIAGQPKTAAGGRQQSQKADVANGDAGRGPAGGAGGRGGAGAADSDDGDDAEPMMRPTTQRDLIRQAFAGDDVEAEFAAEKAAAVAEELPNIEEPSTLPGWGAWSAQQRNPKWMQAAKEKAAKQRAAAAAGRKDANLKYVVVSEKFDKKASKYTAPQLPFPFNSKDAYERSLRQPLGREYNPDTAFRDLTRPAVLKQAGVVIAPLKYNEGTADVLGKTGRKAAEKRLEKRVMTVSGGVVKLGTR